MSNKTDILLKIKDAEKKAEKIIEDAKEERERILKKAHEDARKREEFDMKKAHDEHQQRSKAGSNDRNDADFLKASKEFFQLSALQPG